jgi:hypothetical protein
MLGTGKATLSSVADVGGKLSQFLDQVALV